MLQRARQARGLTLEEAERDTRISRRYLQALENENFGLLPAPVYARGFLRTYARYLGLEPANLLPLFPVGYVEEPVLQPWPKVKTPRTWPSSGLLAGAVVGVLILIVALLYSLGGQGEGSDHTLFGFQSATPETATAPSGEASVVAPAVTATPPAATPTVAGTAVPPAEIQPGTMPDLRARPLADAGATLRDMGLSYLVVQVSNAEMPAGHVVRQSPKPGSDIDPNQVVTLEVSRGP
jgi:cytoskeletal protein RodZ